MGISILYNFYMTIYPISYPWQFAWWIFAFYNKSEDPRTQERGHEIHPDSGVKWLLSAPEGLGALGLIRLFFILIQ